MVLLVKWLLLAVFSGPTALSFHSNGSKIQFATIYTSAMSSTTSVKYHGAAIHNSLALSPPFNEHLKTKTAQGNKTLT